jgi:hypothetical protein
MAVLTQANRAEVDAAIVAGVDAASEFLAQLVAAGGLDARAEPAAVGGQPVGIRPGEVRHG